jgi:two-component system, OmpR family, sensor histidine kinase KdpD
MAAYRKIFIQHYFWTILAVIIVTIIGKILTSFFNLTNVVLLYLLPVLISAVRWGRGPSFFAAFLGVLAFDFLFVPPVFSFTVNEVRDLFVFAVYLIVAFVTGTMATKLRNELENSRQREERTRALYTLSQEIAVETDLSQVLEILVKTVSETLHAQVTILVSDQENDVIRQAASYPPHHSLPDDKEQAVAHWVLEHGLSAGRGTEILREASKLIFPVKTEDKVLAVLTIMMSSDEEAISSEQRLLIEAFANLAAMAIIRMRLAKEAEQVKWLAESEKLHKALLNSISHDMRTPLAAITGAVTSLISEKGAYNEVNRNILLHTIKEEAHRMNRFIANLLDMVRLESGILKPKAEWCDIQDIIGVVLRTSKETLQQHAVNVHISPELPLVMADFILIEQVIINLLENAVKYSPPGSGISISAHYADHRVMVTVADSGPAIPLIERDRVFDKFYRLQSSRHTSGTGLGLSICKGIIEAHNGMIWIESSPENSNRFTFTLPASEQPVDLKPDIKEGGYNAV